MGASKVYPCMYVCVYVCLYVCMCVRACVRVCESLIKLRRPRPINSLNGAAQITCAGIWQLRRVVWRNDEYNYCVLIIFELRACSSNRFSFFVCFCFVSFFCGLDSERSSNFDFDLFIRSELVDGCDSGDGIVMMIQWMSDLRETAALGHGCGV